MIFSARKPTLNDVNESANKARRRYILGDVKLQKVKEEYFRKTGNIRIMNRSNEVNEPASLFVDPSEGYFPNPTDANNRIIPQFHSHLQTCRGAKESGTPVMLQPIGQQVPS